MWATIYNKFEMNGNKNTPILLKAFLTFASKSSIDRSCAANRLKFIALKKLNLKRITKPAQILKSPPLTGGAYKLILLQDSLIKKTRFQ